MATPNTRAQLKDYCLRSLGHPVVQINVADEQIEDRIDDALQFFSEYHYDGVEKIISKFTLTQTEVDAAATDGYFEIDMPEAVTAVLYVYSLNDNFTENFFNAKYQAVLNDMTEWGHLDMIQYDMTRQKYSLIDWMLDPDNRFEFQRVKGKLRVYATDEGVAVGTVMLMDVYSIIDPETYGKVYNDILLKRYSTALIKRQWGANMGKYDGIQLPGGVTFNGQQIYEQAVQELQEIEEQVKSKYSDPLDFFMG
jgi:hypothetical protein